jgi:hypothetical protein
MSRVLTVLCISFISTSFPSAAQNQISLTDIKTINKLGNVDIPNYRGSESCKATISIDEKYKNDVYRHQLYLLLTDSQGDKVVGHSFATMGQPFAIDIIDLDADGEKDFIFFKSKNFVRFNRDKDNSHIYKTLVICRRIRTLTSLKEVLSMPYAGKTSEGVEWKYNHSYFRQDDGNIHIKLTLETDSPENLSSSLPVKTRWINIADRSSLILAFPY